ncbi:MAG: hypothetical protein Q9172_002076 [Xanthocarpia lactea]
MMVTGLGEICLGMAPPHKARRLTWNQNRAADSSDSGYGQEILPTIDPNALAQLPSHEQEAFKEMRMKDRLRVIARWKREGITISPTNDSRAQLIRTSSAPQLPELQMDVSTATFTGTVDSGDSADSPAPASLAMQEVKGQGETQGVIPKGHHRLGFMPSFLSIRSKSSQPELYMDETPEKRCLRKLHRDQVALRNIDNEQDREWCRFRGVGAVPPGLSLSAHSPTTADRINARTITRNHAVVQATRQPPDAYDTLSMTQGLDEEERTLHAANDSPNQSDLLFVRARTPTSASARSPRPAGKKRMRPLHVGRIPRPNVDDSVFGEAQGEIEGRKSSTPDDLHEQISAVHISSAKRMGGKIQASKDWIKKIFKGKTERKKKARTPGRPASRVHLYEEAQVGTARRPIASPAAGSSFAQTYPTDHESHDGGLRLICGLVLIMSDMLQNVQFAARLMPDFSWLEVLDAGEVGDADGRRITFLQTGLDKKTSLIMQAPVVVMNTQSGDRQTGRKAQLSNITAAKTVADIIRSCLGPNAMLKMLLDPMGGIALTNDGHAILREIEVAHPAAKNMIELSRTQDEEVGDGTTTVIILAGEILAQALPQLERNIHPVVIISAFKRALNDALVIVEKVSMPVNTNDDQAMYRLISSAIDTKYAARWSQMMCAIALKAVRTVSHDAGGGKKEVDIKRYAKVEKVPGGQIEDSKVLDGVMLNKDITHPKMRRRIDNPRVVLLDCPLEYKKGESQTNIEISKEEDWNRILQIEEEQVKIMTDAIIALKPDVVITEKGVSDLAQHFLVKHNITALRRVRKTDNNRIARATGATIVNRVEDLRESDVGTQCGLFEIEKIGDEYFTFITKCKGPKACTILLRGPSKDILNEIERNLQDAMFVARNVVFRPRLSPGGGATEMAVSVRLAQLAKEVEGVQQWPYKAVAEAMEVIPRTLVQNSGSSPIRVLTKLRAKHAEGQHTWGVDGHNGTLVDMKQYGTWEPEAVKLQSIKTAIEAACLLLRVDDICSAKSAKQSGGNMGETED